MPVNKTKRDYYEVLGVARTASEAEIKSAYRRLAMQHHPDRNPGDQAAEESFKEASEAYSVLADAEKRGRYDRFGHAGVGGADAGFDPSQFTDFSDIFGDFFGFGDLFGGGRKRRSGPPRGGDLRYNLELSFDEALQGVERQIRFQRLDACEPCKGTGSRNAAPPVSCSTCGGRGQLRFQQGFFSVARTCTACGGAGAVIRDPCPQCRGQGRVPRDIARTIPVPAGIDDGMQLRLAGEGEAGPQGGAHGDLFVHVAVRPHPFFKREGADLYCDIPISFPQAVLGCQVRVPTPWGDETVTVAAGTGSGGELPPLKGKGAPRINARGRGDVHVRVHIDVPRKLTREQRQALLELDRLMPNGNAPLDARLLDKVKDLFA